jgi:hypothetical protein
MDKVYLPLYKNLMGSCCAVLCCGVLWVRNHFLVIFLFVFHSIHHIHFPLQWAAAAIEGSATTLWCGAY